MPIVKRTTGILLAIATAGLAACLHDAPPPASPGASASQPARPAGTAGTDQPLVIRTTLSYTRPSLYESIGRPRKFGLLRDYHNASAADLIELDGAWNEGTQTLTADITITLKSENLVFVDDPAVGPGSETPIRAGRGVLHEIACPETVPAQQPCYLLQVLR